MCLKYSYEKSDKWPRTAYIHWILEVIFDHGNNTSLYVE